MNICKYIIGIDGGGTKTLGVLFDLEGNQINRVEKGFANFSVDEDTSKENILHTIDTLVKNISLSDICHIQLGIAGYSKLKNAEQFKLEIRNKYQSSVDIVTDAEIALYSIKKETDDSVIMVLGGTGSAVVISENDKSTIIGGFGHILGDEGSGYHLAITALKSIILNYEEGIEQTELAKAILEEIKAKDHYEIKNFVYNKAKNEIASLSQFIAEYAIKGNEEAILLFKNEGIHLARQTYNAYKKLQIHNRVTIGIRGGFVLNAPYVKEALIEELNHFKLNYILDVKTLEPIYGAYYLGLKHLVKR